MKNALERGKSIISSEKDIICCQMQRSYIERNVMVRKIDK